MTWGLAGLVAFALGAIPSGLWVGRIVRGIDVREHGSGNLGATNVYRTLGPGWGLLVMLLDAGKGVAAVLAARSFGGNTEVLGIVGLVGAALGHMYTPLAGFRGGKGVATLAGAWATLAPLTLGVALAGWIVVFAITRIVSLASIAAALLLPTAAVFTMGLRDPRFSIAVAVGVLLILRHRSNLRRLRQGQERRLDLRGPRPRA